MKNIRYVLVVWVIWSLLSIFAFASLPFAEDKFPTRPITMWIGSAPGGVQDPCGRALANIAEKYLGQKILVVNKPGLVGGVMLTELKNLEPNGYTIGLCSAGTVVANPYVQKQDFAAEDFVFIRGVGYMFFAICVQADSPWKTLEEFISYAQKNPDKIKYSSESPISRSSLMMRLIAKDKKIEWIHVPYKGSGPAVTALLGGHVDATPLGSESTPYVRSGQLRMLSVLGENRSKNYPDIPTLKEFGYNLPPIMDYVSFIVIFAPRGLRGPVLEKLSEAFSKAAQDPSFEKVMGNIECRVVNFGPEDCMKMILHSRGEMGKIYAPILKELQIGVQTK